MDILGAFVGLLFGGGLGVTILSCAEGRLKRPSQRAGAVLGVVLMLAGVAVMLAVGLL